METDRDQKIRLLGYRHRYAVVRKGLLRHRVLTDRSVTSDEVIEIVNERICLSSLQYAPVCAGAIAEFLKVAHDHE